MAIIGNPIISTDFPKDTFSGNGSTTAFTMSIAPASVNAVIVVVSGITQDPSTYTISGTTLTFSAAPPTGTSNISVRHLGIAGIPNVPADASVTSAKLASGLTASINTLNSTTGVFATQNGMTGIAKAWVNFNGSTSTILGSFNVSSITRNGTADYTINYTTAMPNANYTVFAQNTMANSGGTAHIGMANAVNGSPYYQAPTTTNCRCSWWVSTGSLGTTDIANASVLVIGA